MNKILIPLAAFVSLGLILATMSGLFNNKIEPDTIPHTEDIADNIFTVTLTNAVITEAVPASVEAKQNTAVSSRIMARITDIHVAAGDSVTLGQVMVSLEKSDLLSRVAQAQASREDIKSKHTEAHNNVNRALKLHRSHALSTADLEKTQADLGSLTAQLEGAEQALKETQTNLSYSDIRAPIAGRVIDRFSEPGDTTIPGKTLLTLYNPTHLQVEAQVREQLAMSLKLGQTLHVEIPSLRRHFTATIEERIPAANSGSRSFGIKARLDFDPQLLPGLYARLHIPGETRPRIFVPNESIKKVGQLNLITVLQQGQKHQRFIKTGRINAQGMTEVISGLNEGESIVY